MYMQDGGVRCAGHAAWPALPCLPVAGILTDACASICWSDRWRCIAGDSQQWHARRSLSNN